MPNPARKSAIRYFGDYVLLGEIARGGMGVVYRALQASLDREVAIKMIDAGRLAGEAAVRRFQNEAEAMARLDHPNIVAIYEIGEHEGHRYFAMKLVDGQNLAEHTGGKPLEPRRAAELLLTVTRAVQYAHDRGVLHRDLKPSNILLDDQGKPHVTDFGIAKLVERGAELTGSVAMLGTPEYMAPEQAAGKARQVGTAADTYSLGAVLYYLLTGQPPFKGETPLETLDLLLKQRPVSPRSLNPAVDRVLETICLKCLEKESPRRYLTAEALALDLEKWISGRPIAARPVPEWERGLKWLVRRPVASAAVLIALGLIVAGALPWLNKVFPVRTTPGAQRGGSLAAAPSNTATSPIHNDVVSNATIATVKTTVDPASTNTPLALKPLPPLKAPSLTVTLVTKPTFKGYIKTTPSGQPREIMEKQSDGSEVVQYLSPTGRLQKEVVRKRDGTQTTASFDPSGRLKEQETVNRDGTGENTIVQFDRDGKERVRETIKTDAKGNDVSRIVTLKPPALLKNTSITSNVPLVRSYDRGRFGFVYRPVHPAGSPVLGSWSDPKWHATAGAPMAKPFRYLWGWDGQDWLRHYRDFWVRPETYPAPSSWVTDWLIANYVADRYATSPSVTQAREEARLAREDSAKAGLAAQQAKDAAERAEARTAQAEAEARAAKADARAAAAEREQVPTNVAVGDFKGTPISKATRDSLRDQIERAVAEKKRLANELEKGARAVIPDVAAALADPKHLFLVSKTVSVIRAADGNPAGVLKEGDLLQLESGQDRNWRDATENTFATLRVLASFGEDGETSAGTSVSVALRDLQEFESEFLARLDLGLAEAHQNRDLMK